ncbi:MAG: helix-turn-helix transcriptional regulator [bacterium]|nr:helix-turn-helix transcriptional regulator [bacterium]
MVKIFAEDLKAVRLEKNISLKTIAQQTRLNTSVLENLENGDYTFQPQAYIRAFLKQYIAGIGLDVDETLFDYDLARSGKYKSKRPEALEEKKIVQERADPVAEIKEPPPEKRTEAPPPKKETEEKRYEKLFSKRESEPPPPNQSIPESSRIVSGKRIDSNPSPKIPVDTKIGPIHDKPKKNYVAIWMSSPVIRNIAMILFVLLVLLGLYSLINILFIEGSNDKPEIIRQNFDEVVKEQERKLLGKRTPEEIQDSIRKAEQEFALAKDSITLKLTALSSGVLYIVTDSVNYSKPVKVEYDKGETGVFKSARSFHISSANTSSFKATINDVPVRFDKPSVSKVKLNRNGIVK